MRSWLRAWLRSLLGGNARPATLWLRAPVNDNLFPVELLPEILPRLKLGERFVPRFPVPGLRTEVWMPPGCYRTAHPPQGRPRPRIVRRG
jgi:hypothetical protein